MSMQAGKYIAKAVDGGFGTTKNGNQELVIEFEVSQPPEFAGEKIFAHLYFSDAAFDRSLESLRRMGCRAGHKGRIALLRRG